MRNLFKRHYFLRPARWSFVIILLLLAMNSSAREDFILLEQTNYTNKPDLGEYGVTPSAIIYAGQLWPKMVGTSEIPKRKKMAQLAASVQREELRFVVVDVEHWPLNKVPDSRVSDNINKYRAILDFFQYELEGVDVGLYGMVPIRDYWRAIKGVNTNKYAMWQKENDKLKKMIEGVDSVYPSLYTFYRNRKGWRKYATAQIAEARRLANGKKVIAYLWPRYHQSNKIIGGSFIDDDYWLEQLELVYELGDGIVLWDGRRLGWDDQRPWWEVVKRFVRSKDIRSQGNNDVERLDVN